MQYEQEKFQLKVLKEFPKLASSIIILCINCHFTSIKPENIKHGIDLENTYHVILPDNLYLRKVTYWNGFVFDLRTGKDFHDVVSEVLSSRYPMVDYSHSGAFENLLIPQGHKVMQIDYDTYFNGGSDVIFTTLFITIYIHNPDSLSEAGFVIERNYQCKFSYTSWLTFKDTMFRRSLYGAFDMYFRKQCDPV